MDDDLKFWVPEGVNQTTLHPVGLVAILIFGIAMLILPRRYAIIPMVLTACLVAPAQRIAVFTLNFTLLRIVLTFGCVRVLMRGESRGFAWRPLDVAILVYAASGFLFFIVSWGTVEAVKNRLGWGYDVLGLYFLFRCLVRDSGDIRSVVNAFILVSLPVAAAFLYENRTGHNLFSFLGGVPKETAIRAGRLRCQGAFAHPILAGCFWASLLPLIVAQLQQGILGRLMASLGMLTTSIIVATCSSSTPIMAVLFAAAGLCMFPLRYHMRYVRWGLVLLLLALHMVMNKPVWYLLAKIDIVSGSTGWHRYWLIDAAINHVGEWCLLGATDIGHWTDWQYVDVTNQYVAAGIDGGLIHLLLFISVIVLGFRTIGRVCRTARCDRGRVRLAWALGVSLFVHCMNFLAVCYFGQIIMEWYLLLALIVSISPVPWTQKMRSRVSRASPGTSSRVCLPGIPNVIG